MTDKRDIDNVFVIGLYFDYHDTILFDKKNQMGNVEILKSTHRDNHLAFNKMIDSLETINFRNRFVITVCDHIFTYSQYHNTISVKSFFSYADLLDEIKYILNKARINLHTNSQILMVDAKLSFTGANVTPWIHLPYSTFTDNSTRVRASFLVQYIGDPKYNDEISKGQSDISNVVIFAGNVMPFHNSPSNLEVMPNTNYISNIYGMTKNSFTSVISTDTCLTLFQLTNSDDESNMDYSKSYLKYLDEFFRIPHEVIKSESESEMDISIYKSESESESELELSESDLDVSQSDITSKITWDSLIYPILSDESIIKDFSVLVICSDKVRNYVSKKLEKYNDEMSVKHELIYIPYHKLSSTTADITDIHLNGLIHTLGFIILDPDEIKYFRESKFNKDVTSEQLNAIVGDTDIEHYVYITSRLWSEYLSITESIELLIVKSLNMMPWITSIIIYYGVDGAVNLHLRSPMAYDKNDKKFYKISELIDRIYLRNVMLIFDPILRTPDNISNISSDDISYDRISSDKNVFLIMPTSYSDHVLSAKSKDEMRFNDIHLKLINVCNLIRFSHSSIKYELTIKNVIDILDNLSKVHLLVDNDKLHTYDRFVLSYHLGVENIKPKLRQKIDKAKSKFNHRLHPSLKNTYDSYIDIDNYIPLPKTFNAIKNNIENTHAYYTYKIKNACIVLFSTSYVSSPDVGVLESIFMDRFRLYKLDYNEWISCYSIQLNDKDTINKSIDETIDLISNADKRNNRQTDTIILVFSSHGLHYTGKDNNISFVTLEFGYPYETNGNSFNTSIYPIELIIAKFAEYENGIILYDACMCPPTSNELLVAKGYEKDIINNPKQWVIGKNWIKIYPSITVGEVPSGKSLGGYVVGSFTEAFTDYMLHKRSIQSKQSGKLSFTDLLYILKSVGVSEILSRLKKDSKMSDLDIDIVAVDEFTDRYTLRISVSPNLISYEYKDEMADLFKVFLFISAHNWYIGTPDNLYKLAKRTDSEQLVLNIEKETYSTPIKASEKNPYQSSPFAIKVPDKVNGDPFVIMSTLSKIVGSYISPRKLDKPLKEIKRGFKSWQSDIHHSNKASGSPVPPIKSGLLSKYDEIDENKLDPVYDINKDQPIVGSGFIQTAPDIPSHEYKELSSILNLLYTESPKKERREEVEESPYKPFKKPEPVTRDIKKQKLEFPSGKSDHKTYRDLYFSRFNS